MQPLFWKFWISLCAAMLAIGALTTGLLTQWQHFELHSATQADPRVLIHSVADQLERTLAQGEDPTPILLSNQLSEYGHTYLINPEGADWLERPIPSDMLGGEPASFEQSTTPPSILARAISLPDDSLHFMIFRFDKQSHPLSYLFQRFGATGALLAALLISGITSALLAHSIASPLRRLASVSKRYGQDKGAMDIDATLLQRRDEIGALARQLKDSGDRASTTLSRQKDLVRDVSHEVRTPLARLQVAAELLEADATDTHALTLIQREVTEIDNLVSVLMRLSKDQVGLNLERQTLDLREVLTRCVDDATLLGAPNNVSVQAQLSAQSAWVQGNPGELKQVFENVLTNALRYTPERSCIKVELISRAGHHRVSISDQGNGVPQQHLEDIFKPFFRVDAARQRTTGGFGLGLSLVKKTVSAHGGQVHATNLPDGGFQLVINLPAHESKSADGGSVKPQLQSSTQLHNATNRPGCLYYG